MDSLVSKYQNYFSIIISPSLMASDLPYMLTTSVLDSSIFTFTYPSKSLPWMVYSVSETIYFQKTNSGFLTNLSSILQPQLHPANLQLLSLFPLKSCPKQFLAHSLCPALPVAPLMFFLNKPKSTPSLRPLCSLMSHLMPFALKSTWLTCSLSLCFQMLLF